MTAADEADLMLFKLRQQNVVEDRVLPIDMTMHQLADPGQCLMRLQTVGPCLLAGKRDLLLEACNTNLEELIEVAGKDQQKLQPLQQRVGLIERLFQYPDVELQLRQFAVDIQAAVVQVRSDDGGQRSGRRLDGRDYFDIRLDHRCSLLDIDFNSGFDECFGIHECSCEAIAPSTVEQRGRRSR
ncbi:Unknown protein sequence [Pseudomonas syringae pv. maculicola str. M6]|nr:Unknown protein sequence [Pseudomonas syringae pv. maculicola str. M6]